MSRLKYLLHLAWQSAWNRRGTLLLIVFSIALSTSLLLGIHKIRSQIRENFVQSISGTDLVVGARGSEIQLVLYAIFHLGSVNANMSHESWEKLAQDPRVAWTIPISLGDSHKDYPVVATNASFFEHYSYRGGKKLVLAEGKQGEHLFDVVLGAEVASALNYRLGDRIVLRHGRSESSTHEHADSPFTVIGILAFTGTAVDRSLYIGLSAMEDIHHSGHEHDHGEAVHDSHAPITALLVGLGKRSQVLGLQREINEAGGEALMAAIPAVTMNQIWNMVSVGEKALLLISGLVTAVGLVGLAAVILAGLGERRRELAILRSAGASPSDILLLMAFEGGLLVLLGVLFGITVLYLTIFCTAPFLSDRFGLTLALNLPDSGEWLIVLGICLAGILTSLIPACRAYRMSLADGLTVSV